MRPTTRRPHLAGLASGVIALTAVAGGTAAGPTTALAAVPPSSAVTIRVPQDASTIENAIAMARPGDAILLDRGEYAGNITVPADKPNITIRGVDRNEVVIDGGDVLLNAIEVEADGVTLENLSAHNFTGNGFYWDDVDGFAGRYLTVWNVGLYGIYAIESQNGIFEHSLVSGAADAGFYIGECNPCDSVLTDLVTRYSAIGYSGTNAGGNLEIRDSLWELNGTAIMPNSYDGLPTPAPQRSSIISGNTIRGSGTVPVPANSPLAGFIGLGIAIAGGHENVVEDNTIEDSDRYGIALFPTIQQDGSSWLADDNEIRGNRVSGSGLADLAMAEGVKIPNCFEGNQFEKSLPADIETLMPCAGSNTADGDASVTAQLGIPIPQALERLGDRPDYTTMPEPAAEPTMPDALAGLPTGTPSAQPSAAASAAASPATSGSASPAASAQGQQSPEAASASNLTAIAIIVVLAMVAVLLLAVWSRRRRRRGPTANG